MLTLFAGIFQAVPDAFESVSNFFYAGKLFMVFLLALSLLSISVVIYKALDLRRRHVLPDDAVRAIESAPASLGTREVGALAAELRSSRSVLSRLGLVALSGAHADKEDASRAVEARAREEVVELESGVALLEVVITIAPLLGLLGTVSGLVNVFSNLGDSADHAAIAIGIAEALNTTIAGLAIAVPTVVAHSFFMKKIERMGVRLEILLGGLVSAMFRKPAAAAQGERPRPQLGPEPKAVAASAAAIPPSAAHAPSAFTASSAAGKGEGHPPKGEGHSPSGHAPVADAMRDPDPAANPHSDPALDPQAGAALEAELPWLLAGLRSAAAGATSPDHPAATGGAGGAGGAGGSKEQPTER